MFAPDPADAANIPRLRNRQHLAGLLGSSPPPLPRAYPSVRPQARRAVAAVTVQRAAAAALFDLAVSRRSFGRPESIQRREAEIPGAGSRAIGPRPRPRPRHRHRHRRMCERIRQSARRRTSERVPRPLIGRNSGHGVSIWRVPHVDVMCGSAEFPREIPRSTETLARGGKKSVRLRARIRSDGPGEAAARTRHCCRYSDQSAARDDKSENLVEMVDRLIQSGASKNSDTLSIRSPTRRDWPPNAPIQSIQIRWNINNKKR